MGSPDLADREQAMVVVSSKVMTTQATAWGTIGNIPTPTHHHHSLFPIG